MRIAYVCPTFYARSETFIRDLALGLAGTEHAVRVFADEVAPYARQDCPGDIVESRFLRRPSVISRALSRANERIRGPRTLSRPVLEHRHARRQLLPLLRDFAPDAIYADYGPTGVLLDPIAAELDRPLVVHFHGYDASAAMVEDAYRQAIASMLVRGRNFIVPSEHMRRLLVVECGSTHRISVIPYAPKTAQVAPVEKTRWPSVVALGRLTAKKNPLAMVEAFRIVRQRIPSARMTMIGEGPQRRAVEERIKSLGLGDAVALHGAMPHDEALRLLGSHWVFAQHSVTAISGDQEGLPVAILEAMSMGIPVVSTIHSGIPEVIIHGETGLLAREHDFEAMADHLESLLADHALRERLSARARRFVSELGARKPRVESVVQLIERAVGDHCPAAGARR